MDTKRIWRRDLEEKRGRARVAADFYAVELADKARYLRRIANVSGDGLLMESPLRDEQPGQIIHLELPQQASDGSSRPLRVRGEVVYVTPEGRVGVHVTSTPLPVAHLGGPEDL